MSIPDNQNIIIIGMHRSGTSLVAGILSKCGIILGTELLGKHFSNPMGHFEDRRLVDLNDRILSAAGGTWYDPPSEKAVFAQADRMKDEIVSVIGQMPVGIWGWKDPRLSLTIELFLPYLHNPIFIICNREPVAVAESLRRRNGIEIEKGLSITGIYKNRIGSFLDRHPDKRRMVVSYEEICFDPASVISRIVSFIGLDVHPKQYQAAKQFFVPRKIIGKMGRRIRRNELIKAGLYQLFKNPIVFFAKLVKYIWVKSITL